MSLPALESAINAAFDARDGISTATKGEVREAVDHALDLLDKGEARVALAATENAGATALSYTVKAQVGGKIAQIGSRLVDGAAQKLADDFFGRFSDAVAAKAGVAPVPVVPSTPRHWIRYLAVVLLLVLLAYLFWQMKK